MTPMAVATSQQPPHPTAPASKHAQGPNIQFEGHPLTLILDLGAGLTLNLEAFSPTIKMGLGDRSPPQGNSKKRMCEARKSFCRLGAAHTSSCRLDALYSACSTRLSAKEKIESRVNPCHKWKKANSNRFCYYGGIPANHALVFNMGRHQRSWPLITINRKLYRACTESRDGHMGATPGPPNPNTSKRQACENTL